VNFGAAKFQVRKLGMAEALHQAAEEWPKETKEGKELGLP
jgi:hypothetical protein